MTSNREGHPGDSGKGGEERERALAVREMFGSIAGRYDLLNHLLSANIDRSWRRICVAEVERRLGRGAARTLDVGCGTADLSLEFAGLGPVVGCDFCHPMLRIGREKAARAVRPHPVELTEGDALQLPFGDGRFDAVVSAFVLRNLANLEAGLREMRRVLRVGGVVAVLDFGMPSETWWARLYRIYFTRVLPRIGRLVSGVAGPYSYLPDSVQSFPQPGELLRLLERCGFHRAHARLLTAGVAVLLTAEAGDPPA